MQPKQVEVADVVSNAEFLYTGSKEKLFKFHSIQVDLTGVLSGGTFKIEVQTQGTTEWVEILSKDFTSEPQAFNVQGLFDGLRVVPDSITGATAYTVTLASGV